MKISCNGARFSINGRDFYGSRITINGDITVNGKVGNVCTTSGDIEHARR